jgi:4-amino-4-deoxy-L-arabinose transferase-like glycosyltransferase
LSALHLDSFDAPELRRRLLLIVGVAMLLRIVWAALVPVVPQSDGMAYDTFARNLVNHGVFGWNAAEPFAYWPPGTSMFYAAVYKLAGFDYLNVVIANLAVALGMLVCTARVVARFVGARVALWSVAVLAVWPTLIMLTTLLVSEQLFLFLTIAALDAWTSERHSVLRRGLLAGVLLGAASLVRPVAPLLPFLFAGAMLCFAGWQREQLRLQLGLVLWAAVAMAFVIAPWAWRNYQLLDHFVLVSANGGVNLWMGNVPGSDGYFQNLPDTVKGMSAFEADQVLGALAREYILADPMGFVWRSFLKLIRLYNNESIGVLWNSDGIAQRFGADAVIGFKRFTQISWAVIFGLAILGALLMCRHRAARRVLLSPLPVMMACTSLIHAMVVTGDRYHLAAATQIAMLAGFALEAARQRWAVPLATVPATKVPTSGRFGRFLAGL